MRSMIGQWMLDVWCLRMTPDSIRVDIEAALIWHRMHLCDPSICTGTRVFPWFGLVAFRLLDHDCNGEPFIIRDWWSGEEKVSEGWLVRRLMMPPALEWCVPSPGRIMR